MTFKIAICKNEKIFRHSEMWTDTWITFCEKEGLDFQVVDCYRYDVIQQLRKFDLLLWHPSNYVLADMMEARSILYTAERMGLLVFPDYNTSWHFDDKIAQSYLLQSAGAPVPESWMFYILGECREWLELQAEYPLIAKLKSGSGSTNVKMLESKADAVKYAKRMFRRGFNPAPSVLFKAKSKIQSSHDWKTAIARMKRIPEFLHSLSHAKQLPKEHGYCFFQEFIPNDGYDLKVVVIGDKICGFSRKNRKGDFRASGGGDIVYDNDLVTEQVRNSALETSRKLGFQCMGFDYVVDNRTSQGYIVEMCFGFSNKALMQTGGYWDLEGRWFDEPLSAPEEILKNMINERMSKMSKTIKHARRER